MAFQAGYGGAVKILATAIDGIGQWSGDFGRNLEDTSCFGDSWKKSTPTQGEGSFSFEVKVKAADEQHAVLRNAALNGTLIEDMKLFDNATNAYTGDAYIKIGASAEVAGVVKMTINGTCDGPWTYA